MNTRSLVCLGLVTAALVATPLPARASDGAPDGWKPYILGKDEQKLPFPESLSKLKDKEWLKVGYTEFPGGFKPRLGVVFSDGNEGPDEPPMQNETLRFLMKMSEKSDKNPTTIPASHVEDMVRQALTATGRFTMLERTTALGDVTSEQDAGASGRVDKKTAAATGKLKGADFIVKATILEMNPEKESSDIKAAGGGLGGKTLGVLSFGVSGKVAYCRLNVRLVNATTGVIVQDMTVDGTASSKDVSLGGGMLKGVTGGLLGGGGGVSKKEETVISNAIQACANKIAYFTALKLKEQAWEGSVAGVDPLLINAGSNIGLTVGLDLKLLAKGAEVLDDDGTSLGYASKLIGRVRITEVQEKFSTCEIIEGGQGVKKGDVVQLAARI